MNSRFRTVPEKPHFPTEEENVLKFWEETNAFKRQLQMSEGKPEFTFYDGPPFATGLPHYGHIAAGTIKDVITRYATMDGHHVERRFGWDCHGLPIEFEIDKIHKIKDSAQREALGVKRYNELCREIVMKFSSEWKTIIGRFGRWIDFENDYKTMDAKYMESVWWTFKQIFNKDLVYRGTKIMPYSTKCNTVLSNSEAGSNYKDVSDPAIIVTFPVIEGPLEGVNLIAWTTTPWTLPSNLATAVNPKMDYVHFVDTETEKTYVCMKDRLAYVIKQCNLPKIKSHKVLNTFKGTYLVGVKYKPLFNYFEDRRADNCFSVIAGSFVTKDAGTGIVHCAPGFGVDDYDVCVAAKLITPGNAPIPIDADGQFLPVIEKYAGQYVKDADEEIEKDLKAQGRMISKQKVKHSYPYCWRSQSPLLYRGFDCWFIRVTEIKQRLVELNKTNRWVPSFVQEKRFHNWLDDARDWCISRTRFWGNPIPIWVSDDGEEIVCIGSVKELEELSGVTGITDLHKESIDHITIPSKEGKGVLKRIPEVFDCWFESGSMPFAQNHYPFSMSEEKFQESFPANFIAEGLDQTRGWFYSLSVISGAIKDTPPFQNLIVNGIVLAEDGTKMSKSKQNYTSPLHIAHLHGADACRLYLMNSPIVRAEKLKFSDSGVKDVVKDIFLPWFNAYRFLIQNITRYEKRVGKNFVYNPEMRKEICGSQESNYMDRWIIAANQNTIKFSRAEIEKYKLYTVAPHILSFLENLTNWYVKLNRPRMKGDEGVSAEDQYTCLNTLFDVLLSTCQLMAPFTPFLSEYFFQNLKNGFDPASPLNQDSIHFTPMPNFDESLINEAIEKSVSKMQDAIITGRLIRGAIKVPMKWPLRRIVLIDADQQALDDYVALEKYIKEELNCFELATEKDENSYVTYSCEPENKLIGQALKKANNKEFGQKLRALTTDELKQYLATGKVMCGGHELQEGWLKIGKDFKPEYKGHEKWAVHSSMLSSVMLDKVQDEECMRVGCSREATGNIQKLRKSSGISIDDQIEIFYECSGAQKLMQGIIEEFSDKMASQMKMPVISNEWHQGHEHLIDYSNFTHPKHAEESVKFTVCLASPKFVEAKITADFPNVSLKSIKDFVVQHNAQGLAQKAANGQLSFVLDNHQVTLVHKVHFFFSARDLQKHQKN